jgi:hypothetical protein
MVSYFCYCYFSIPTNVPVGCAMFPNELAYQPECILKEKYTKIVRFTNMPRGGHFAAFEEPELLSEEIWETVKIVETLRKTV